jgi:hypothetical protein
MLWIENEKGKAACIGLNSSMPRLARLVHAGFFIRLLNVFPDEIASCFLLRDRDQIHSEMFRQRVVRMEIEEVITAARSPWQNPFVERVIGSIRRECLNHVIVLGEAHLRRILTSSFNDSQCR